MTQEYKLKDPPQDLIQSVEFGPSGHLLVASWDNYVRLYDVVKNQVEASYTHSKPVLDVCFESDGIFWSGGADKCIIRYDLESQKSRIVGQHEEPVKSVEHCPEVNLIATGGWDRRVSLWDPRTPESIHNVDLGEKVYSMGACGNNLIIGCSNRKVFLLDLRTFKKTARDNSLKYQIRCVKPFTDKKGYVVASIEGRCAVEYFDLNPTIQRERYAFKCHRVKDSEKVENVYPVNSISFHPYNTFATGGSDGFVSIWDGRDRKRLVKFHQYPTSISSVCFSRDGGLLAIASSSHQSSVPHEINVRRLNEAEVRTKHSAS